MKVHSFVRNNAQEASSQTNNVHSRARKEFRKFLYFLFAPTLIYRDEYPRYLKTNSLATKTLPIPLAGLKLSDGISC